mgnify:CR=1 FL=1
MIFLCSGFELRVLFECKCMLIFIICRTFGSMSDPAQLQNMCYDLSMDLAEDLKAADLMVC